MSKHGHTWRGGHTATYNSWRSMIRRCGDPTNSAYGGRGISVCERWRNFAAFLDEMGERPTGTTIGRLDKDGNYEPGNVAWQTKEDQLADRGPNRNLRDRCRRGHLYDECGVYIAGQTRRVCKACVLLRKYRRLAAERVR